MFSHKKGSIMRHPYVTIAILGLAAVGAVGIGQKVKVFVDSKIKCINGMMNGMKNHTSESM